MKSEMTDINYLIVILTQAMLGLVTPSLLGIAIDATNKAVTLHFAVDTLSPGLQTDIDDIASEFEAFLYPSLPPIEVRVFEGYPSVEWPGWTARQVFRAKR